MGTLRRFLRDEKGATAVEYGVLIGLLMLAIVASLKLVATGLTGRFGTLSNTLS